MLLLLYIMTSFHANKINANTYYSGGQTGYLAPSVGMTSGYVLTSDGPGPPLWKPGHSGVTGPTGQAGNDGDPGSAGATGPTGASASGSGTSPEMAYFFNSTDIVSTNTAEVGTNQILYIDGSLAVPPLAFKSSTQTGIYNDPSDGLVLAHSANKIMSFNATLGSYTSLAGPAGNITALGFGNIIANGGDIQNVQGNIRASNGGSIIIDTAGGGSTTGGEFRVVQGNGGLITNTGRIQSGGLSTSVGAGLFRFCSQATAGGSGWNWADGHNGNSAKLYFLWSDFKAGAIPSGTPPNYPYTSGYENAGFTLSVPVRGRAGNATVSGGTPSPYWVAEKMMPVGFRLKTGGNMCVMSQVPGVPIVLQSLVLQTVYYADLVEGPVNTYTPTYSPPFNTNVLMGMTNTPSTGGGNGTVSGSCRMEAVEILIEIDSTLLPLSMDNGLAGAWVEIERF